MAKPFSTTNMPRVKLSEIGLTAEQAQNMFSGLSREEVSKKVDELRTQIYKTSSTPPSATELKQTELANSGLKALENVDKQSTFINRLQDTLPGGFGAGEYRANMNEVIDTVARLRTGAALTKEEQDFYEKQLPKLTDSRATINSKVNILSNFLKSLSDKKGDVNNQENKVIQGSENNGAIESLRSKYGY